MKGIILAKLKSIKIINLKHIAELEFELPEPGVHLLSGSNGAGKTSLLACLHRIGNPNAFARHFQPSTRSNSLDNFDSAQINYTLGADTVTYAYGGERWVPRPRSNSHLLKKFGYPEVLYIGATADRITPRPEDFALVRLGQASQEIRDAANKIFATQKFDGLKVINLTRGAGNQAFLLQATPPPKATYFSERNFSLGELCVLKLIRRLKECRKGALVLIDELELALHPRAQIELFKYLKEIAPTKNLTIVFSTHSVSLLKSVDRNNILFLSRSGTTLTTIKGCYPAYALGNIAYSEERAPDVAIYVEDDAAVDVTEALLQLSITRKFGAHIPLHPNTQVLPIGPFMSVVRHLAGSDAVLPQSTRVTALLDADVKTETLANWRVDNNYDSLAEFQQHEGRLAYLPWTPEVGLVDFLRNPGGDAEAKFRNHFRNHTLLVRTQDIGNIPQQSGADQRKACKRAVTRVAKHLLLSCPNMTEREIKRHMFSVFAEDYFQKNQLQMMALFGPML